MMLFPAHFVSNLQSRRAHLLRTCRVMAPTVARRGSMLAAQIRGTAIHEDDGGAGHDYA
jgi:hypothetical protein